MKEENNQGEDAWNLVLAVEQEDRASGTRSEIDETEAEPEPEEEHIDEKEAEPKPEEEKHNVPSSQTAGPPPYEPPKLFQELVRWRDVGAGVVRGGWMTKSFALRDAIIMGAFQNARQQVAQYGPLSADAGGWEKKCARMKALLDAGDDDNAQRMAVGWLKPEDQEQWYDEIEAQQKRRRKEKSENRTKTDIWHSQTSWWKWWDKY